MTTKVTAEKLRYLIDHWYADSVEEIAGALGVSVPSITGWAKELRKRGVKLPYKTDAFEEFNIVAAEQRLLDQIAQEKEAA